MPHSPLRVTAGSLAFLVLLPVLPACRGSGPRTGGHPASGAAPTASSTGGVAVTPVRGPSWLHHLGLDLDDTAMGRMGGSAPPTPSARREPEPSALRPAIERFMALFRSSPEEAGAAFREPFQIAGSDLYRLSCRSCHGPDGRGAPPEIHSLLDPVRNTSPEAILARMKARGTPLDRPTAESLAAQAEAAIRQRLAQGGEKMPPFADFDAAEIDALLTYLRSLAGAPSGGGDPSVTESSARVGEHLVKGTCHTCHDATGPGGGHMAMMRGIVPSLASIPQDSALSSVVHQVQAGSSPMMGMMRGMGGMGMGGGRATAPTMPALPYLTEEEVAAAYFYLVQYPPEP